jgi:competence protein ComEC
MDMGFPPIPDMSKYKCQAGYYLLHESLSCPADEECIVDGTHICRKLPAVDPSGGDGPNCDAGYVTARINDCADLPESGDGACVLGKIAEYCRPVPADAIDPNVALTPVRLGQRCSIDQRNPPQGTLRIHIIDVGQGDAIWIQTPDQKNILVDAGDAGFYNKTRAAEIIRDYFIFSGLAEGTEFDAYILTHPHSDHFGGFSGLFSSFPPKNYIDPGSYGPPSYNSWIAKVNASQTKVYMPAEEHWKPGDDMPADIFGNQVKATYIYSKKDLVNEDSNNASIMFRLTFAGHSMLFTGDAEAAVESTVTANHPMLIQSHYYKVCHHGSGTSSTESFLTAIWEGIPQGDRAAFISSGRINYSGSKLPLRSVVERLVKHLGEYSRLFSTAAGDDEKSESEAIRDDNILIVIKPDGTKYACYSGTN